MEFTPKKNAKTYRVFTVSAQVNIVKKFHYFVVVHFGLNQLVNDSSFSNSLFFSLGIFNTFRINRKNISLFKRNVIFVPNRSFSFLRQ